MLNSNKKIKQDNLYTPARSAGKKNLAISVTRDCLKKKKPRFPGKMFENREKKSCFLVDFQEFTKCS